jgi:hypothetical protein
MNTGTQQFTLYDAEAKLSRGRVFQKLPELQAWVDELRETWWWQRFYPQVVRVEVGPARNRRESVGWFEAKQGAGRIEMTPTARDVRSITHELAHVMTAALHGDGHGHDPVFAREYGNLTWFISGPQAWLNLQAAYVRHGVDYGQDA